MVLKCCVPNCKGNYNSNNKAHVFKFPKDEVMCKKWLLAIPRQNYTVSNYSVVCDKHFKPADILWETTATDERTGRSLTAPLAKPKLLKTAVPCIYPNSPAYFSCSSAPSREGPEEKRKRIEAEAMHTAVQESISSQSKYLEKVSVENLSHLKSKIDLVNLPNKWCSIMKEPSIIFMFIDMTVQPHFLVYVTIGENMLPEVYCKGIMVHLSNIKSIRICNINQIENLILEVDNFINKNDLNGDLKTVQNEFIIGLIDEYVSDDNAVALFMKSQLKLSLLPKNRREYTTDFLIFCSIFYFISPHAYNFFRNHSPLILPHTNTLQRICSNFNCSPIIEQNPMYFLQYIKEKVQTFEEHERNIVLMMDEIYIKPYMDYKGGNIVGACSNSSAIATSAQVYMIQSILSSKKEVVHIFPVAQLNADDLHKITRDIIVGLENAGLNVLAVVSDNNAINSKAMTKFSTPPELHVRYFNPVNSNKPLFYLFDSVHLFKTIRNNWLNQKTDGIDFVYPDFNDFSKINIASLKTVRDMYEIERNDLLKFSYGLSVKALWPTNFERQNVKFVCQLFNEHVVNSLLTLGEKYSLRFYNTTAEFLKIIITWWHIMNVKTPLKGVRLKNKFQEPLTNKSNDERIQFLYKFSSWLDHWNNLNFKSGKLSTQTQRALQHTTLCILQLTDFCSGELKWSYVLPGKFQTDALEARFGQYRQLAGGQYHVSVRQIYEIEKKIRLLSTIELPVSGHKKIIIHDIVDNEILVDHDYFSTVSSDTFAGEINVTQADLDSTFSNVSLLTYIAGYCCYSLLKKLNCNTCEKFLVMTDISIHADKYNVINNLNRGSLKYPVEEVVYLITYNYVVIKKMLEPEKEEKFLSLNNHRKYVTDVTLQIVLSQEILNRSKCDTHTCEYLYKNIIWKCTNILLNNYCKLKNNVIRKSKTRKSIIFPK